MTEEMEKKLIGDFMEVIKAQLVEASWMPVAVIFVDTKAQTPGLVINPIIPEEITMGIIRECANKKPSAMEIIKTLSFTQKIIT